MKCSYCGTPLNGTDKYCPFCGAEVSKMNEKSEENANNTNNTSNPSAGQVGKPVQKKKMSAKKIVLIVFLCSAILSSLIFGGLYALIHLIVTDPDFDSDDFFSDTYDDHYFDDEDDDFDDDSGSVYHYSDRFSKGITDVANRSYISTFSKLSLTLPESWKVYSESEINDLYKTNGISRDVVEDNLVVYDFFAENELNGSYMSINYYNVDYTGFDAIGDFKDKCVKRDLLDQYPTDKYKVDFADDSMFTFDENKDGEKYFQVAAKITDTDGYSFYEYVFIAYEKGYYIEVWITASDLDTVGEVIEALS